jgi:hypothetical protein
VRSPLLQTQITYSAYLRFFFGVVSLLRVLMLVTLQLPGEDSALNGEHFPTANYYEWL